MSKWRKKPVVIEAFRWTGGPDQTEDPVWACNAVANGTIAFAQGKAIIQTLEGAMTAEEGDWIIKGFAGEIYSCKPDIFAAIYEPA